MFQWLVVEELHESATRVGTAQMAGLVPSLFFVLIGGVMADRVDRRRALVALHLLAATACAALGIAVGLGQLSFGLLIAYALVAGTLQSFIVPNRDAQLSDVVDREMSRAVAGMTMVQHVGQSAGSLIAGLAALIGSPAVLGVQSLVAASGALAMRRLPPARSARVERGTRIDLREVRAGVVEVLQSRVLRPVMLLNVTVGIVFVGTYLVLLPLLVREFYGGGAARMGVLVAMIPIGSILANLGIVARGGMVRKGRALLLGQGFAGLCLGAMAFEPPFWGTSAAAFGWGIGAAFAINASRTLFQEHASEANRGRVLSVYTLAVLGAAPLGAQLSGYLADGIGTLGTLAVYSAAMTLMLVATGLISAVGQFE